MAIFLPSLKNSGQLDRLHLVVCNVGSRKLTRQDDYGSQGWEIFAPNLTICGFDADADACQAANSDLEQRSINWEEIHIPLALSNRVGESTLYVTKSPMCSSLYAPNESYLARFAGLSELVNLDFTVELETTTLDAFCADEATPSQIATRINAIDFLQIDVQGADLLVLQGASQLLSRSVLAVQIEVEFSPLYREQPLFADVDSYLRTKDFTLFDLVNSYRHRQISPIRAVRRAGQILWADAFYFRDLLSDRANALPKTPEQLLKLACIADVLDFPDYTLELLTNLTQHHGSNPNYNFADSIVESLSQFPPLVEKGLASLPVIASLRDYITRDDLLAKIDRC